LFIYDDLVGDDEFDDEDDVPVVPVPMDDNIDDENNG
jgi:hypothetical protein